MAEKKLNEHKIEISRKRFIDALKYTKECAKNNIISMFDNICLKDDRVLAYNGIQGIMVKLNTELNCLVKPDLLYKLVSSYETDLVVIEKGTSTIKVDNTTIKCVPENSYQFNIDEKVTSKFTGSIPLTEEVMEGIEKCMSIVNVKEIAEAKLGVSLLKTKTGISFNSMDELRVAKFEIPEFDELPDTKIDLVLPLYFCKLLAYIYKGQEDKSNCHLHYSKEDFVVASLNSGSIMLYTKINKGLKIFDFEREFTRIIDEKSEFVEIPKALFSSIARTNLTAPKENISLIYKDGKIIVKTKSETCTFEEGVEIDFGTTKQFTFRTSSLSLREVFKYGADIYYNEKENVIAIKNEDFITIIGNTD